MLVILMFTSLLGLVDSLAAPAPAPAPAPVPIPDAHIGLSGWSMKPLAQAFFGLQKAAVLPPPEICAYLYGDERNSDA